jgi:hypothetical protein
MPGYRSNTDVFYQWEDQHGEMIPTRHTSLRFAVRALIRNKEAMQKRKTKQVLTKLHKFKWVEEPISQKEEKAIELLMEYA